MPLATLVAGNAQPLQQCRLLVQAAERGDVPHLLHLVGHSELGRSALRYAGVLDGSGILAPTARDQLLRLEGVIAARQQTADEWEPVMTVPAYLRGAIPLGNVSETLSVLLNLASTAQARVVLATPFLDAGFEPLGPALVRLVGSGGRVLLITRELTRPDSPNARAVERLRRQGAFSPLLEVVSWEEEGLGLHIKAMVVDGARAYVGSANFTWGGLGQHAELGARLTGPSAHQIERLLERVAEELRRRRRLQAR